jgi:23S rRNA (adenine2030-N6)-methyltransferase
LRAELSLGASREPGRLTACGLIVVNPPWTLASELATMLPELVASLSAASGGAHRLEWLAGES